MLLLALLALSATLWGAASFVSPDSLGLACTLTGAWLLAFAVREWSARSRRRAAREG
ncbi:hypothetical protein GXW82_21070 [Streptacidiphilus sp. 4-A2]|nr:hypothetical protein [Streptacidiphilus sp. 4-A2]